MRAEQRGLKRSPSARLLLSTFPGFGIQGTRAVVILATRIGFCDWLAIGPTAALHGGTHRWQRLFRFLHVRQAIVVRFDLASLLSAVFVGDEGSGGGGGGGGASMFDVWSWRRGDGETSDADASPQLNCRRNR